MRTNSQVVSASPCAVTVHRYMAGNAGIMLRKAQLMRKQERAQRATEALLDVVKLVSSDHNIHELVEGIIQAAFVVPWSLALGVICT